MNKLNHVALIAILLLLGGARSLAATPTVDPKNWADVLNRARGQIVYFDAWAGEARTNDYIAWAAREISRRFSITLRHVKLSDTAEAVSRVIAEKAAARDENGSIDLIWINGPNFAAMKQNNLLFGPWAQELPNFAYVDIEKKPAVSQDFAVAPDGLEAPWGLAQLVFYYDAARLNSPPKSTEQLLAFAQAHPGRFTYPDPSNFLGATFLKQILIETVTDKSILQQPVDSRFDAVTAPLWAYLDTLNPLLWRGGRAFPADSAALRSLLADHEIDIAFSFDPAEASASIARGELPSSVRSYVLTGGTLGNANFLAIPYNAAHKEGAMVVANFLLSPEAQARKQDPALWGGMTVLSMSRLSPADRKLFDSLDLGIAGLSPNEMGAALAEPQASWMPRLTEEWRRRYGAL
jgi:putative thiamine transport system substrate-binding protein